VTVPSSSTVGGTANSTQTTAAVGTNPPEDEPLQELSADLARLQPQVDPAAVPARNAAAPASAGSPPAAGSSAPPVPASSNPDYQQGASPSTLPNLPPPGEDVAPFATPGPQPIPITPTNPPATGRGPSLPSPALGGGSTSGSSTSAVTSTPGPVWPLTSPTFFAGSSQSFITPAPQVEYISGGCDEPCGAKCKIHKLCPFKKHKQMIASSHYSPVVLPSAQGVVSSCGSPCMVKKQCFLKAWLHHKQGCKLKGCKGCKKCDYCGEPAVMVSAQDSIVSPQW
jgi:hypothetical protein